MSQQQSNAIVRSPEEHRNTLIRAIESKASSFAAVLPKTVSEHVTPQRLIKVVLSAMSRNPTLLKCTPASIVKGLMQAAELGLEIGAMGEAYLVPFWNKHIKSYEATFMVGYRGYKELAFRGGRVKKLVARAIREGDEYEVVMGNVEKLYHKPQMHGTPGELIAVYAIATLEDDVQQWDLMLKFDVDKIRARAKSKDDGPWVTDYNEMAKKTVFRRLAKMLPMTPELRKAIAKEEAIEAGDESPILDVDFVAESLEAAERGADGPAEDSGKADKVASRLAKARRASDVAEEQPASANQPAVHEADDDWTDERSRDLDAQIAAEQAESQGEIPY